MSYTDSNGILMYEDTDAVTPLQTLLNTGQASVSTQIGPLKTSAFDTGWVNCIPGSGSTLHSRPAQVRRIGKMIFARGGFAPTSGSYSGTVNVGTVPANSSGLSLRPDDIALFLSIGNTIANSGGRSYVNTDGSIIMNVYAGTAAQLEFPVGTTWLRP